MKENVDHIIEKAKSGDVRAFEGLVMIFQDAVFGTAYSIAKNFHDAEEITQETFVIAYQELSKLREPDRFPAWLHKITTTACNRFLRSRKDLHNNLADAVNMPSETPGQDSLLESKELEGQIIEEFNSLSAKNRLVTALYFINGYSYQEIGHFLELPVSTVKSRLHKSREILKERLIDMVAEILSKNKPDKDFIKQLKEKLNGKIIALADGRIQVFYDFVDENQLQDWRQDAKYKSSPEAKDGGLAFGRVEPEETENQWDRDIRLSLVFDTDPEKDLEIEYDVIMGTCEPWSDVAWALTSRDGIGEGIGFFYAALTNYNEDWRNNRNEDGAFKDGYIRGDFLRRIIGEDPKDMEWINPTSQVPIAEIYHMKISRHDHKLRWEANKQLIGDATLADDELSLTERLILGNHGKGKGAIYQNVTIRSSKLEFDPYWHSVDKK